MKKLLILLLCGNVFAIDPDKSNLWSDIKKTRGEISQSIGSYANGCQMGAQVLPEFGEGFQSIRRWRNRFYSQQTTIDLVHYVGAAVFPRRILIGDLSLPIGGLMPFGHSSHQNGLDVDIWFYTVDKNETISEDIDPPSLVDKRAGTMRFKLWKRDYREALYAAATFPKTARIFVNPVIKQYLCETETERMWLQKIRPWGGHDSHFHVRLQCPEDFPHCENQNPIPDGDGCNADLLKWVQDQSEAILNPKTHRSVKPRKSKPIHKICLELLKNQKAP